MDLSGAKYLEELYTDYLMVSTRSCTATGLSRLTDNLISHDKITRVLSSGVFSSQLIWKSVKPFIREIESSKGCISIDDSIQEKVYTDENSLICWHFDHTKRRSVKGVNFITAQYCSERANLPVAVDFITKPIQTTNPKTGKPKRKSDKTKNDLYRELLMTIRDNHINFGYVLNDIWFSSSQNMTFVKKTINADFVMAIKGNRKVALSLQDKSKGKYVKIEALPLEDGAVIQVWFEQVDFPVSIARQVFKNGDGSEGILYLVTSDLNLTYSEITTIYQKRWKVEEYHKSVKSNASFAKSPTRTETTQKSHFYASILAYVKYEVLNLRHNQNHFALKERLYLNALQVAYHSLKQLDTINVVMAA
jgi:hypothetical protein